MKKFAAETSKEQEDEGGTRKKTRERRGGTWGFAEGFGMGMHDARSEITGFAEPAIMAL